MSNVTRLLAPALALLPLLCLLAGGEAAPRVPSFEGDVRPLLAARCLECHGEARQARLDLRLVPAMLSGGARGPALVRGAADRSLLYRRAADGTMPPGGRAKLTAPELAMLRTWIEAGAPAAPSAAPGSGHWAFRPPARSPVPAVRARWWVRSPIDSFVLARLERAGIAPPRAADRLTLLRRASLDVTGLPPTPAEQRDFLGDRSPGAWERVVDRLLASPAYGERWARHWLDVARYAESNGYERDGAKPSAWRYRDYVIASLNADRPYDRFLTEQIAGDELPGSTAETQIATTFLRLGTWDDEPAEVGMDRYDQLDDVLGTTATAFMGVTLRCARCHDHKFEPFSQRDYYGMLAVFEPLKRPQEGRADLDRLVGTRAELEAYHAAASRADAAIAAHQEELEAAVLPARERALAASPDLVPAEAAAAFRTATARRSEPQRALVRKHAETLDRAAKALETPRERETRERLERAVAAAIAARPPEPPRAYVWYEDSPQAPPTRILERGDPAHPRDEVRPAVPTVLAPRQPAPPQPGDRSTGRRLWLARWLARPEHPLTARVIVNRVWQGHFGEGIVPTENDFGIMGRRPSDPALLDWLATTFTSPPDASADGGGMGWSLKRLHRLILLSNTYKAAATWRPEAARRDPEGRFLWRWQPRRLEAEAVRDGMLAASGQLNRQGGGPSVYPPIPRAVLEGQSRPGSGWGTSDAAQAARRSVYIFSKRSLALPELEVLDAPDTTSSCEQRAASTIAPQALTFLNGEFTREQARHFAARLEREAGAEAAARVRLAFELTVCRPPDARESEAGTAFLAAQESQIAADGGDDPRRRALEAFCLVMLNNNEFFYLN